MYLSHRGRKVEEEEETAEERGSRRPWNRGNKHLSLSLRPLLSFFLSFPVWHAISSSLPTKPMCIYIYFFFYNSTPKTTQRLSHPTNRECINRGSTAKGSCVDLLSEINERKKKKNRREGRERESADESCFVPYKSQEITPFRRDRMTGGPVCL